MKINNIKKTMTTLAVIMTVSFSTIVKAADDVALPVISKPAVLQEGTQRDLTPAQVAELLPWAKNSKIFLTDLLDNVQGLPSRDKNERLIEGIKSTVNESAPKNSELLMRYALNRGLVVSEVLSNEMDADAVGSSDVQSRVLVASINMAIRYYDADMLTMTKKSQTSFAGFGVEYYRFLTELNKSVIDASAQYAIQKTALEWLQWDLYRDLNNASYAPQIVKINNALKVFPNKKMTDAQALNYVRQMKKMAGQLNFNINTLNLGSLQNREKSIKDTLEVGDRVIYSYNYKSAVVAGIRNNKYTIKFDDDDSYSSDVARQYLQQKMGCDGSYCVGDEVIYVSSLKMAKIEAIASNGMTLKYIDTNEMVSSTANYSAKVSGCGTQFCVGDKVVYTYTNAAAVVVGFISSTYIIRTTKSGELMAANAVYMVKDSL